MQEVPHRVDARDDFRGCGITALGGNEGRAHADPIRGRCPGAHDKASRGRLATRGTTGIRSAAALVSWITRTFFEHLPRSFFRRFTPRFLQTVAWALLRFGPPGDVEFSAPAAPRSAAAKATGAEPARAEPARTKLHS